MTDPDLQQQITELRDLMQRGQAPPSAVPPNGFIASSITKGHASNVINLDEQLARIDVSPQPVVLGGHVYRVRRDFTATQGTALLALSTLADGVPEKEIEFWAALVGSDDAARIRDFTAELEYLKAQRVVAQILVAAGLGTASGALGEA